MTEEIRFFVRTGIFVGGWGVVYWVRSYEVAGTILLGVVALAALGFALIGLVLVPETRAVKRKLGFEKIEDDAPAPMVTTDELFPTASIWPMLLALGALLVGLGLLYGAWLWLPGAAIGTSAGLSWFTQLRE